MTQNQAKLIADAIVGLTHGPTTGANAMPTGMEAIVLALAGGFAGTGGKSVASSLDGIANALDNVSMALDAVAAAIAQRGNNE